jgi:type I restriction enzyme, S subunit
VEAQDKIITAARELKKSPMRHLFIYGPVPLDQADQVPLKETEIGPVPEHWEVVQLGEVARIRYGLGQPHACKPSPMKPARVGGW